jgi:Cu/Ag efflux protein CusF
MKRTFGILVLLIVFAGNAFAHNGMEHVMGTVTAITDTSISVRTADEKIKTVALASATKYVRGDSPATLKDIKVGDHIVIHATKKGEQLTAAEVKAGMMTTMRTERARAK